MSDSLLGNGFGGTDRELRRRRARPSSTSTFFWETESGGHPRWGRTPARRGVPARRDDGAIAVVRRGRAWSVRKERQSGYSLAEPAARHLRGAIVLS